MKNRLIFLLIIILASRCYLPIPELRSKEKPARVTDGVVKKYRENGKLLSEISLKDGKRNGPAKDYYENGNVHHEIHYVNNLKHGLAKTYYEGGGLYKESTYDSGRLADVQKKYRQNGKLMAEIPYENGFPGKGLKEYLTKGSLKTNYPRLVVKPVDKIASEDLYVLEISFDEPGGKKPEFYVGELINGRYLHDQLQPLKVEGTVAQLPLELPPSTYIKHELNIIGVFYTRLGNPYIVEKKYLVDIKNTKPI